MLRAFGNTIRARTACIAAFALLGGCEGKSDQSSESPVFTEVVAPNAQAPDIEPSAPTPAAPALPDHNYDESRGSTYYYISALSEEDEKKGRAVGSVSAFQYLGKNADGEHILASMKPNGTVDYRAKCAVPCKIIDADFGANFAYSPRSIIGGAFEDAMRGRLKIADWARDSAVRQDRSDSPAKVERSTSRQAETTEPVSIPEIGDLNLGESPD